MLRLEAIADVGLLLGGGSRDRVKPGLLSLIVHFKVMPRDRAEAEAPTESSPVNLLYDVVYEDRRISDNTSAATETLHQRSLFIPTI